jgi:hypothetical protein
MLKGRTFILVAAIVPCIAVFAATPCAAQSNNIAAAARAFSLGQEAELAGNYRLACEHYELADRTVPSPEALRSAAKTRLKAGDEAMAATHAEALARRYSDEKSHKVAEEILKVLRPKLARVSLSCTPRCGAVADGGAVGIDESESHVFYVEPGRHTIGAGFASGDMQQEVVDAVAGKSVSLTMSARADAEADADQPTLEASAAPPSRGISRVWFFASAAVTVALGGVTIWSGLDVLDRKDAYEADPTRAKLQDGRDRELRTNVLIGVTAAAAVATGFVAWRTRWSSSPERPSSTVGFAPTQGGAIVVFERGFP